MKMKIIFPFLFIMIVLISSIIIAGCSQGPGKYDDFANCLTEKGFVMGGTDWCHLCKEQKKMFGKSFGFVNYRNCDINKEWCDSNEVDSYPTWILPNGTKLMGVKTLLALRQLSGCDLE